MKKVFSIQISLKCIAVVPINSKPTSSPDRYQAIIWNINIKDLILIDMSYIEGICTTCEIDHFTQPV